jgi:hypothetical protein
MPPALLQILRSRWFAGCAQGALWLLLYLVLTHLGGRTPDYRDDASSPPPNPNPAPISKVGALFASANWPKIPQLTNAESPFFTRQFVPPPSPAPPPPPTTRKIELAYQGFFQTADRPPRAVVKIGDAFISAPIGGTVATKLYVANATMQTLTLTNHLAQTNVIPLNAKKELEVPLQ